jgi:uncharacterized protein (TIGR00369 family)
MNTADAELTPLPHTAQNRCFGCGPANPHGMHLEFYITADGTVVCLPTLPDCFEGPPGHLHGGIIATLLDEAMSKSLRGHGLLAMTRHMEVNYLRPIPSLKPIRIEARRTHYEGKKQYVQAHILNADGVTLATAKALFIEVKPL